jgi:uncharacterized phage protein (TIGR01671 family)
MREILFRGKDTKTGKWRYSMTISRYSYDDNEIFSYYIGGGYITIDGKTLGQYTGLTDKNGKKIFEGDIIAIEDYDSEEKPFWRVEGVVKYGKFNCSCCDGVYGWYIENGDIRDLDTIARDSILSCVGNIHDNPELLWE